MGLYLYDWVEINPRVGSVFVWSVGIYHMVPVMCMVCGTLGKVTKLCAYSLCLWFKVSPFSKGRVRLDRSASLEFYSIVNVYKLLWCFEITLTLIAFWNNEWTVLTYLKIKILLGILGRYKLVSEPWFKGFRHTLECVWTQTEELIKHFNRNWVFQKGF